MATHHWVVKYPVNNSKYINRNWQNLPYSVSYILPFKLSLDRSSLLSLPDIINNINIIISSSLSSHYHHLHQYHQFNIITITTIIIIAITAIIISIINIIKFIIISITSTLHEGEIWNRFNLISEERVKSFEQNSENLMKIGWKISVYFEALQIFTKHFWKHRYEYANEWVDVIASLLAIYFVHKILKIVIFSPKLVIVCPSYQDIFEHSHSWNMIFFCFVLLLLVISVYKMNGQ